MRYFIDRLLVVIDQVDDLTMLGRQLHQCSAHQFAPILFLQCDFRVIRRIRDGGLDFLVQLGAFVRRRRADRALWRAIDINHVETEERHWKRPA
jgi:hypothetical protein